MAVNLSALAGAGQQFFDNNGVPLAGGKLFSYAAGTTTPQATYTSATGVTTHSNPIVLDSAGRVAGGEIWLTAGSNYKFVLTTNADVLIATWDNITGINGTGITSAASNVSFTGFKSQSGVVQDLADNDGSNWIGFEPAGMGAVAISVQDKLRETVSVKDFGAVGDGVTDDGAALNTAIAYFRSILLNTNVTAELDLSGGKYLTSISIDATKLVSWGWKIKNGTIIGECTGKPVLDMIGSRGGFLENIIIEGSETDMPYVGIQVARGTGIYGFCDNCLWSNVSTIGYFSLAGVYIYGQETTTYEHCRFWNYNPDGYAGIHAGNNVEPIISDYMTAVTGVTSFINNKYLNCDWRYLPSGNITNITGISKSNPVVITAAGHPFNNGDTVAIGAVNGMTQINNAVGVVANKTANNFEVTGIDSTAYSSYTSGGQAVKVQTKPTVWFARGHQHSFDTCYVVNYGTDNLLHDPQFLDNLRQNTFDFLFEGIGSRSHIRFLAGASIVNYRGYTIKTYNTHTSNSVISTDATTGRVRFDGAEIKVSSFSFGNPTLFDDDSKYQIYGCNLLYPVAANFDYESCSVFKGTVSFIDTGLYLQSNNDSWSEFDGVFTPTITTSSGTITSFTATGNCRKVGNLVFVEIVINITDNGTGSGTLSISNLPIAPALDSILTGRESASSGNMLQGFLNSSTGNILVAQYNNAYPVTSTSAVLRVTGVYAVA